VAASGQNPPTKQAVETFADLAAQTDLQLNKLQAVMSNELKQLNKLINDKQVPVIGLRPGL